MAFVSVPKDLTKVKNKIILNLTKRQLICLGIAAAVLILCTYYKAAITWYYIVASVIAAFIVYLVATGGWEKVKEIWERTKYKNSEGE